MKVKLLRNVWDSRLRAGDCAGRTERRQGAQLQQQRMQHTSCMAGITRMQRPACTNLMRMLLGPVSAFLCRLVRSLHHPIWGLLPADLQALGPEASETPGAAADLSDGHSRNDYDRIAPCCAGAGFRQSGLPAAAAGLLAGPRRAAAVPGRRVAAAPAAGASLGDSMPHVLLGLRGCCVGASSALLLLMRSQLTMA